MDTLLFDPKTSTRRALILALGTYTLAALSSADRESVTTKLLDIYQNDPDAGIHGAAEWALRQWHEETKLSAANARLPTFKNRGDRRWYASSQGETFVMIDGPVEFTMGSPPTDPEHDPEERSHRRRIPRKFAIAAKEVGIAQYQKFPQEQENRKDFTVPPSALDVYSPDRDGPIVGMSWFIAVAYCNWLSKQEGLPEAEWCYVRNANGKYDVGMTIPDDFVKRKGYRLPTEAEWEYACRSGSITSRYYGLSLELLARYARYPVSGADYSSLHAGPRGSLLPNDLGLFDMLGNVYEWCHERSYRYTTEANKVHLDNVLIVEHVDMTPRILRGSSFDNRPLYARSAGRLPHSPSYRGANYGFRLARTYD